MPATAPLVRRWQSFEITEPQVNDGEWPPPIVWDLSMSMMSDG